MKRTRRHLGRWVMMSLPCWARRRREIDLRYGQGLDCLDIRAIIDDDAGREGPVADTEKVEQTAAWRAHPS
jgi:hypothetical protein